MSATTRITHSRVGGIFRAHLMQGLLLKFVPVFAIWLPSAVSAAQATMHSRPLHTVVVIAGAELPSSARHGLEALEASLRTRKLQVSEDAKDVASADAVVFARVGSAGTSVLSSPGCGPIDTSAAEAFSIRAKAMFQGKRALVLCGSDATGLMYAALDLSERISWTLSREDPFTYAKDVSERPFLQNRSVVMFTMNRAYFESRLHDREYWKKYFDMLGKDRINELVLTFGYENGGYMAPFYPYFFDVPGYPDVKVVGLTVEAQKNNFDSLRAMVEMAAERGIRIKPGIWDHIYRGGGQEGRISWASDGSHPTEGLVWGLNTQNLIPYTIAALDRFYTLFPEIHETQFRMHNESGLLDSEIDPFWHAVFRYFAKRRPGIELELRAKGLDKQVIQDAQRQGIHVHLDTKIWMEQMGLPYDPTLINAQDRNNARHSYADLLEYPKTYWVNWTLWNGGTQRLLEWFDPEYASRLAKSARLYDGPGLAVTEMEGTKMLSEPPDEPAHDFFNPKHRYFDYEFERYWAFYECFGRLAYDPQTSSELWRHEFAARFGADAAPHVMRALELSSGVLPRIVAAAIPYSMFPTTTGWPEMMHMGSLPSYAEHETGSDVAQFENVQEEAARLIAGGMTGQITPEETSAWFSERSDEIMRETTAAERAEKRPGSAAEVTATITDARILAALARYYAARLMGGVNYNLYRDGGSLEAFDVAVADEGKAVQAWREIVAAAGDQYIPKMYFGTSLRGFPHHWSDELPVLEKEYAALQQERSKAAPHGTVKMVAPSFTASKISQQVTFLDSGVLVVPGKDLAVGVRITRPEEIRSVVLRYRHVNQKETYNTVAMTHDNTGIFRASIPGGFITPQWDLMYYLEIIDRNGKGRIFPDLNVETPYVVRLVDHRAAAELVH